MEMVVVERLLVLGRVGVVVVVPRKQGASLRKYRGVLTVVSVGSGRRRCCLGDGRATEPALLFGVLLWSARGLFFFVFLFHFGQLCFA